MEQKRKQGKKLPVLIAVLVAVLALLLGGLALAIRGSQPSVNVPQQAVESEALASLRRQLADPAVTSVELNEQIVTEIPLTVVGEKTLSGTGAIRFADTVNTDAALLDLQSGADMTLDGVTVDAARRGNGIYIPANAAFTLKSGTVQFANGWNVYNDGTFHMQSGLVTGAKENNVITSARTTIAGGEISAGAVSNIQVIGGTARLTGGNILTAGGSGVYVAQNAALEMNGELLRIRESGGYGVEVHGSFTMDYGNILKNGADNVYVGDTGAMVMNDGYIATAVTCGIKSRGVLEIHGGTIEYNGTDGVDTAKSCVVDGGNISFNARRGFTNATGGALTVQGEKVIINANKFGLYNEFGSVATLRDMTIRNSGTNNIRNFGELNLYNYTSKDSASVHLSTLSGSKVYMENVVLDTNGRSHGVYNYCGHVEFKNLTITSPAARGIRNIGGTVTGENYAVNGTFITGLTNEDVEGKVGYVAINNITFSGVFDYGIYNFAGTTKLVNVQVGVTNKNSLRVEAGDMTITNATFEGCNGIPGQPDAAVYDAYFTGGTVTLNDVTLKNSYSSLIRNRSAEVTLNHCTLTGANAAAINNSALADTGAYGNIVCNNVTFRDNQSANVKSSCDGTITLNDCYMGLTRSTNVAAEQGTIILNNSIIDGTAADGEKVGFVVYEGATGIMQGNSIVRNTYGKGISVLGRFYMYDGTVANCSSRNGAALNNEGAFYIYGGTLKGNTALEGSGGAIRNKGTMYIENLLVEDNLAYATGGAISNGGEMTVENAVIRNNRTEGEAVNGGAIYAAEGTLTLNKGTVIEGNVTANHGGGLAIKDTATVVINDGVVIRNNTAAVGSGGAAINYGTLILNGGEITGNAAGKHGGGIASSAPGVFHFVGGSIDHNTAGGNGGGVYHGGGSFRLSGGTVADNTAAALGGSIAVGSETEAVLSAGSVFGGKAETVPGVYIAGDTQVSLGADVRIGETVRMVSGAITLLAVRQEPIAVQYESYYPGQQILRNPADAAADLIAASVPAVTLVNCEYSINDNGYLAGNAEMGYVARIGNAKYFALESAFAEAKAGDVIELLSDCAVSGKLDAKGVAGTITLIGNGFTVTHGAFDSHLFTVRDGVTLVLGKEDGTDVLILDGGNQTEQKEARLLGVAVGGKVIVHTGTTLQNSYSSKHGGAVLLDGGELILNGGVITGHTANGAGGAVFAQNNSKMTIVSGTISGNKTQTNHGGALYFKGGSMLIMDGGSITGNSAETKAAGAVMLEGSSFTMNGGSITGNHAKTVSGAIHTKSGGVFTMNGGSITGNAADGAGGAISAESGSAVAVNGGAITGNTGAVTNGLHIAGDVDVSIGGKVVIEDIYLATGVTVNVTAMLDTGAEVNFTLPAYEPYAATYKLLTGTDEVLSDCAAKVTLTDANWMMDTNGHVKQAPQVSYVAQIQGGESFTSLHEAIEAAPDGAVIDVLTDTTLGGTIQITKNITILGNGNTIRHAQADGSMFTVSGHLILGNESGTDILILDGGSPSEQSNAQHIIVPAGGTLTIYEGVTLQNAHGNGNGGSLLLQGGTVYLNGGKIIQNKAAKNAAAVFMEKNAVMIMNGGQIAENAAAVSAGAVYIKGGSRFIMNGGEISNNTAGATGSGGAIYVEDGMFTLDQGKISGNNVTGKHGGAVFLGSAKAKLTVNAGEISGNTAKGHGGAVCVSKGLFTLTGGVISGNTANGNSGGVHVADGGTLRIRGGEISGNTAAGGGGNIAVAKSSILTMEGGTVGAGTAAGNGKSVYIAASSCTLAMSGSAAVTDELFLDGGSVVTVAGKLTAKTAATLALPEYTPGTQVLKAADGVELAAEVGKFALADSGYRISETGFLTAAGILRSFSPCSSNR